MTDVNEIQLSPSFNQYHTNAKHVFKTISMLMDSHFNNTLKMSIW